MTKHAQRPQKADQLRNDEVRPLVVKPLENLDRMHNPKDIEVDEAAIRSGIEHGGTLENRGETLATRGEGGRKRTGPYGRHRGGRDLSKRR